MKFTELGLNDNILKAIKRSGFEEATPIQAQTIPVALAGQDVIGQAQTGTGKTAAFGLPILQKLDLDKQEQAIQAIVIEPARELAIQTQEELFRLGRDENAKVQVVYGGADNARQSLAPYKVPGKPGWTPLRRFCLLNRKNIKKECAYTLLFGESG